ncbi:MAG: AAA family ATPase [Planctomycetota bacterium]|nr:AAA family ATPase [Planctomycetota bacterium]
MLEEIYCENFVLFERASLRFSPGLNAISGETGAGKSLIAQALSFALGERADADWLRAGAEAATVCAVFCIDRQTAAALQQAGVEPEAEGKVIFERSLRRDGRTRLAICGRPASAALARAAAARLIDLAAQNEYTRLMDSVYQRWLLDRYGRLADKAEAFAALFKKAASLYQRLQADAAERSRMQARLEQAREDLRRLQAIAYDPRRDSDLETRIRALRHAEEIRALAADGLQALYEGENAAQDTLARLQRECQRLSASSAALAQAASCLEQAEAALGEAVAALRQALEEADCSPGALDALIERAEALKALARRLGCEIGDFPAKEKALVEEIEHLAGWESESEEARSQLQALLPQIIAAGLELRQARQAAARRLARAVKKDLQDLGLEQADFAVEIRPLWREGEPAEEILSRGSENGLEEAVFLFAANPGEKAAALAEIASGGEMSRAMLAIKAALAALHEQAVLFFDEIDTGVGSRLGDAIARKLAVLASARQVIAITHLPQVAAQAQTHLKVSKQVVGGRTIARAEALSGAARIEEVAEMIAGAARTATTRRQAEEMLRAAGRG